MNDSLQMSSLNSIEELGNESKYRGQSHSLRKYSLEKVRNE